MRIIEGGKRQPKGLAVRALATAAMLLTVGGDKSELPGRARDQAISGPQPVEQWWVGARLERPGSRLLLQELLGKSATVAERDQIIARLKSDPAALIENQDLVKTLFRQKDPTARFAALLLVEDLGAAGSVFSPEILDFLRQELKAAERYLRRSAFFDELSQKLGATPVWPVIDPVASQQHEYRWAYAVLVDKALCALASHPNGGKNLQTASTFSKDPAYLSRCQELQEKLPKQ